MNIPTTSDVVMDIIKKMILSGELKPGQKLNIDEMSRNLNISKTPIREVIKKLEQEGLLKYFPRVGWKVTNMTKEEYFELYELQELLEVYICEKIEPYIDDINMEILVSYNEKINDAIRSLEYEKILELNELFHLEIYKVYKNKSILNSLKNVWNSIKIQRNNMVTSEFFIHNIDAEHELIIKALKDRDIKLLVEAQKVHFKSGKKVIEDYYKNIQI